MTFYVKPYQYRGAIAYRLNIYTLLVLSIYFAKHLRYANLSLEKAGTSVSENEFQSVGQGT